MACMEHECDTCKAWWSDNLVASDCPTPGCNGTVSNWHDETFPHQGEGEELDEDEDLEEEEREWERRAAAHEMPTSADGELKL